MPSDDDLRELGRLAVAAAKVESFNRTLLNELIDEDPSVGRDLFPRAQFRELSERILPLAEHRDITAHTLGVVKRAVADAQTAMAYRNDVLHSHWTAEGVQLAGKSRSEPTPRLVTTANLRAVAVAAENAADHLALAWFLVCGDLGRLDGGELPDRWAGQVTPTPSTLPTDVERLHRTYAITSVHLRISGLAEGAQDDESA